MSGQEREVLDRVAVLMADGSLPPVVLESMDGDAFHELAAWVLAGAGGLFPPVPGADAGALFAGVEVDLGSILNRMMKGLLNGASAGLGGEDGEGGEGSLSRLAGLMGLDGLDAEARAALLAVLAEGLETADPGAVWEAVKGLSSESLSTLLQEAMAAAGLEADGVEGLPDLVLRGLVVELLDGRTQGTNGRTILGNLMHGADATRFGWSDGEEAGGSVAPEDAKVSNVSDDSNVGQDSRNMDLLKEGGKLVATAGGAADPDSGSAGDAVEPGHSELLTPESVAGTTSGGIPAAVPGQGLVVEGLPLSGVEEDTQPGAPVPVTGADASRLAMAPDTPEMAPDARPVPAEPAVSTTDMLQNIERIEQIMRVATRQNGIQHVTMQLSPPHLGRMSLSVEMRAGVLTATLRTESVDARNLVLAGMEQLRKNLEVQGVQLEGFDVSVDHGEAQNQEAWQHAREEQQAAFRRRANRVGVPESGSEVQPAGRTERMRGGVMGDGSVNIVA